MLGYISNMQELTLAKLANLHQGVSRVTLLDFPDHTNVGDSAIALGEFEFWRRHGVDVAAVYSRATMPASVLRSAAGAIALHGGGNLGGLYPPMEALRLRVAAALPESTLLIQLPQSVVFRTDADRVRLAAVLGRRANTRVAARDRHSEQQLEGLATELMLVPDAVHALGSLEAAPPTERLLVLARTDPESNGESLKVSSVDWERGNLAMRASTWAKYNTRFVGRLTRLGNPSPRRWEAIARRRLQNGLDLLASGEVVITDRLHGMLLALQMGRRVIAVDNANSKLSNYAQTWMASLDAPLEFAENFAAAIRLANRRL